MKTAEFDYELSPELIAQTPIEPRDAARLMVVERSAASISQRRFHDLPEILRPGDLLVHNESRVIPARLFGRKPTGGRVEILLLRQRADDTWETLVGGKRVREGLRLSLLDGPEGRPTGAEAEVIEAGERGMRVLAFDRPVLPLAEQVGVTPLPPYIHTPLADAGRYQTVYARAPGSAAAPTAGLHFTPELIHRLREMDVRSVFVTLHIGLDTFRPVSEERVEDHHMHTEHCSLTPEAARQINQARLEGRRIIAVGTTSVRVLETAALAAVSGELCAQACPWQAVSAFEGATDLFIYPGYEYRVVDAMITNFHLPRSTLLMLVAAFAGKELLDQAYAEALRERYRFYSFGDAMLIF
ncbi:MAG: tRNA preQ1(34) S-adenosylmethionine ribosyltransferase-isomerase QueA [Chloroflexi bacterium]|nr:MAG: tRNA preQ1(34) S-adenosylmethionine ribosyltransferase-isomerase QueA [Anaerolineaceae bacterium 4572_32.2]RLC75862.1 MAG: tRNA preQ1(34) S-adenosylmethionine ribosyltransferase-isomerase QueA [Chloroflexota bacterium]RLC80796.1 MAG: tRNA preQ1(34) S-adenosylmethionine ribosyltransferase-isomerase QueA [Chloroflexota bacterium]HEY72724.1 tRNA preQ1(34) S-adenosylmethionine ribosyltransferase-isomerase QueA [Thermoflexia bacterium]